MCRRTRVLEAAALVDGDVDEHTPGAHPGDQVVRHQGGCLGSWYQHRADHEVGVQHGLLYLVQVRRDRLRVAAVHPVDLTQLGHVLVQDPDVGLHTEGDLCGVHARDAGADDDDLCRLDTGHPAHQDSPATLCPLQDVGADLGGHPARDFAHRR
jgi:hypothetical protein